MKYNYDEQWCEESNLWCTCWVGTVMLRRRLYEEASSGHFWNQLGFGKQGIYSFLLFS